MSMVNRKLQCNMTKQDKQNYGFNISSVIPDGNGGFMPCPELMTEEELIRLLRVPEISKAKDYHNVITHLKKYRDLPCIHICRQPLYPASAIADWVKKSTENKAQL